MAGACLHCGEVQPTTEENGHEVCQVCGSDLGPTGAAGMMF